MHKYTNSATILQIHYEIHKSEVYITAGVGMDSDMASNLLCQGAHHLTPTPIEDTAQRTTDYKFKQYFSKFSMVVT